MTYRDRAALGNSPPAPHTLADRGVTIETMYSDNHPPIAGIAVALAARRIAASRGRG